MTDMTTGFSVASRSRARALAAAPERKRAPWKHGGGHGSEKSQGQPDLFLFMKTKKESIFRRDQLSFSYMFVVYSYSIP